MKHRIDAAIEKVGPRLDQMTREMYEHPELGNQEHRACKLHVDLLREHGFDVETNFCGLETGFKAVYKAAKPGRTVVFMVEYDALPGIGHGCGHNISGAVSTGAGIALKEVMEELGGTLIVLGTPAEETDGAKVIYAEKGVFKDVDIAMMCHSADKWVRSGTSLALMPLQFEYFGKPSHAASAPEKGVNALDGALITFNAINALREHVRSDSRIHGVIIDGGKAANVVPDYCKVQYYVRSTTLEYNEELIERVKNCARAGALASGTRLEISQFELAFPDLRTNETLSQVFCDVAEQEYGVEFGGPKAAGATDAASVSKVCPTIHPYFDIVGTGNGGVSHSRERADCTVTPYAAKTMRTAAGVLAMTAVRCMTDDKLLADIKAEFAKPQA